MKSTKQNAVEVDKVVTQAPRLVKAEIFEARLQAKRAEEEARKARPQVNPAVVRAPRNANEARSMFDSLFQAA